MRLVALVLAAILPSAGAFAQEGQPSPSRDAGPPVVEKPAPLALPVSVERIRGALQGSTARPLLGLEEEPLFRVEIREKQRFEELISSLKFDKGPVPRGGLYAYEQQQSVWSPQQHPEMQPYAPFNQGQLVVILFQEFLQRYLGGRVINAVAGSERTNAEEAAHEEVRQALAGFWAYQAAQLATQAPLQKPD